MIPCFNRDGMVQVIGFSAGCIIIDNFNNGVAACKAKQAADPTYKPNPFADKPTAKSAPKTSADAIAAVVARVNARKGS